MSFRERAAAMRSRVQQWRGEAARYTPAGGGAAIACTAVVKTMDITSDFNGLPVIQTARVVILLTAEVAAQPTRGATVEILDAEGAVTATHEITEDAMSPDSASLTWRCRVGEPVAP